jgi:hypothetical protein
METLGPNPCLNFGNCASDAMGYLSRITTMRIAQPYSSQRESNALNPTYCLYH